MVNLEMLSVKQSLRKTYGAILISMDPFSPPYKKFKTGIQHMNSISEVTLLTSIARQWSIELGTDFELVASILYRWNRGDYSNSNIPPNLSVVLSSATNPAQLPAKPGPTLPPPPGSAATGGLQIKERPLSKTDLLVDDISGLLDEYDPFLEIDELRRFCSENMIPEPALLSAPRKTPSANSTTPSKRELGKARTKKLHEGWKTAYKKLAKEDPDMFDTDIAKKISNMICGGGKSSDTIRKIMKKQ